MKKVNNFDNLMNEVYKSLYEKKTKNDNKLTDLTKEVLLKIKKNTQSSLSTGAKAKYALMFNQLRDNSKISNETMFDKINTVFSETMLKNKSSNTKKEISNFISTARIFSSPHITSNTSITSNSSNTKSKFSTPIKAKMNRVKSQIAKEEKEINGYKVDKKRKSNSIGNINYDSINNLNNSKSLRTSLDNFRVELEQFLKKDLSVNNSFVYKQEKKTNSNRKKVQMNLKILNSSKMEKSPEKKSNDSSFMNSNYGKFMSFLPKENVRNNFFKIGKKESKNMSLRMNSFRTRMQLQNL